MKKEKQKRKKTKFDKILKKGGVKKHQRNLESMSSMLLQRKTQMYKYICVWGRSQHKCINTYVCGGDKSSQQGLYLIVGLKSKVGSLFGRKARVSKWISFVTLSRWIFSLVCKLVICCLACLIFKSRTAAACVCLSF